MNVNATRTGYYLAKFMNTVADFLKPLEEQDSRHYNPMYHIVGRLGASGSHNFRSKGFIGCLGEIEPYLCFAQHRIVVTGILLKIIREKSGGITDVTYLDEMAASKETFRTLIQNERRIEFAFENQRFWDLRRWLLPLNEPIYGMRVIVKHNHHPLLLIRFGFFCTSK